VKALLRKVLGVFSALIFFLVLPALSFWGAFSLTDFLFREKGVPYPFEYFGAAIGLGCALWTAALFLFLKSILKFSNNDKEGVMKKLIFTGLFVCAMVFASQTAAFADEAALSSKLDQVLKNQEQILNELQTIKSELAIVKVRATNR